MSRWAGLAGVLAVLAAWLPLAADEAYYWTWSQVLDWGYFDHPPGIAWLIRAGSWLPGELGVRAGGIGLWALAVALLGRRVPLGPLAAPGLLFVGLIATPDAVLLPLWALALMAWEDERWWLAGLLAGLAALGKLPGWVLLGAFMAHRPRSWTSYAAAGLAILVNVPSLIWCARNDWVFWTFQADHALGGGGLGHALGFWAGQLLVAGGLPLMTLRVLRRPLDAWGWSGVLLLPLLFVASLGGAELNWGLPLWLSVGVLVARAGVRRRGLSWGGVTLSVLALGAVSLFPGSVPVARLFAGPELAAQLPIDRPVLTSRYQEAAWIRFYTDLDATTFPELGRRDQFDRWPRELPEQALFLRPTSAYVQLGSDRLYEREGEVQEIPGPTGGWQVARIRYRGPMEPAP